MFKIFWLLLFLPIVTSACPVWHAKFKDGQLAGWDYLLNPQNIQMVADPSSGLEKVLKMTITPDASWPNGHTRVEAKHKGCSTNEGQHTFFSWEFYLDKPVRTFNHIAYWETNKTYQQSMGFSLQADSESGTNDSQLAFFSSQPERRIQWKGIIPVKTWHKISLAIKWSENKSKGEINLWLNNKQVIENLAIQTKPDANQLFIQLGLHRNQAEVAEDSIYLKNIKELDSLAKLLE